MLRKCTQTLGVYIYITELRKNKRVGPNTTYDMVKGAQPKIVKH